MFFGEKWAIFSTRCRLAGSRIVLSPDEYLVQGVMSVMAGGKRRIQRSRGLWSGWPYLTVLLISFSVGVLAGAGFAFFLEPSSELAEYLREYCAALSLGELRAPFVSVLWDCVRWPLLLAVLGLTVLGIVGIPALFLVRGFLMAFSTCTFGVLLGLRGAAVAAALFAVTALLGLPALFMLGCGALRGVCLRLPGAVPATGKTFRLEAVLICTGVLAVSAAIQWTVTPAVLSEVCSRLAF